MDQHGVEIVNPVPDDELAGWSATMTTTFLAAPEPDWIATSERNWRERLEPGRRWGAREGGRWVATLASDALSMTVPGGGSLPVDALTGVTVSATHRRRGLLTSMLTGSLAAARERGDALAYLVAAEWPIYGRFGYAPATRVAHHTYRTRLRGAAVAPGRGTVRQVEAAEFAEVGPRVFDAVWGSRAGEISHPRRWWRSQLEDKPREGRMNLVVHEGPHGPDGLLMWKPVRDFHLGEGLGAIEVQHLHAADADAYRGLWSYLAGIDVVDEVHLPERPVDEPARYLMGDGRALHTTFVGDFTWLALLDVPVALAARSYRADGRLVLEVVDPSPTRYAAGRWQLDAGPAGATCTPSTASADLTLPASALASAYLGDFPLALTRAAGGVEEHTAGAAARFDLMFGTALLPWCSTGF